MLLRHRHLLLSVSTASLLCGVAGADIFWTGAVSSDVFDEANWDLSASTVTVIDPGVSIDDNVRIIDAAVPAEIPDEAGQVRFQIGDGFELTVDNSSLRAVGNDGVGGAPGTSNGPSMKLLNGAYFEAFFIVNRVELEIGAGCEASFGGGFVPINISTVDLTATSILAFTDETIGDYLNEHLSKTSVDGSPAVPDGNIRVVSDGAVGCIVTVLSDVGSVYCTPANLNSSGTSGVCSAFGQYHAEANDLELSASGLPKNELGYFLCSQTLGFTANPGGSQGNLCIGGKIGRFVSQVQDSGSTGSFSIPVDLDGLPVWRNQAAQPGETWYFQAWFKDGSFSNFTDGLEVTFL